MASQIITDATPTAELMEHYASILANFQCRMSLSVAEKTYTLNHGELTAAIESGKCRAYKRGTRYQVSHQFVAEYVESFCTVQNDPLPS